VTIYGMIFECHIVMDIELWNYCTLTNNNNKNTYKITCTTEYYKKEL